MNLKGLIWLVSGRRKMWEVLLFFGRLSEKTAKCRERERERGGKFG